MTGLTKGGLTVAAIGAVSLYCPLKGHSQKDWQEACAWGLMVATW